MGDGQSGEVERGNLHWVKDWEVDVEEDEDEDDEGGFVPVIVGGGGGGGGGDGGTGGSRGWWEGDVGVVGLGEGWVVVQWRKKAQEKSGLGWALSLGWWLFMAASERGRQRGLHPHV